MDSLTQIVLGAAVGEAVLGKKVGNKAMLYGAIAGTIPDLDTFVGMFTDPVTAVEIHRGFSHSIAFALLAAPLFGYLISTYEKQASWKQWSWLLFWGLVTHPILDAFTTWGTQLFWPLENRLEFKTIFVIDPLYTLPFLIFLVLAMRQDKEDPRRSRYNRLGLIISTSYLMLTVILKMYTYQKFEESLDQQGIFYLDMDNKPSPLNTILWTANVETQDAFLIGDYSLFDTQMIRFKRYPKNHHYLGQLKDDPEILRLIDITSGWYTITSQDGELFFNDLRFGQLNPYGESSQFTFSYRLIVRDDRVARVEEVELDTRDGKQLLTNLWTRIKGN